MDYSADPKVATINLLHKSCLGIGVVLVAILTTLPAAWAIEPLRGIYVWYLYAVSISLFAAIGLLVAVTFYKDVTARTREMLIYAGLIGLLIFMVSTIIAAWRLTRALSAA